MRARSPLGCEESKPTSPARSLKFEKGVSLAAQGVAVLQAFCVLAGAVYSDDASPPLKPGERTVIGGHEGDMLQIRFSPDGKNAVAASYNKTARIWNFEQNRSAAILKGHQEWVFTAIFLQDGKRVATGAGDGIVRIFDSRSGQLLSAHTAEFDVADLALSPDGQTLAAGVADGRIVLFRFEGDALIPVKGFPAGELQQGK